MRLIPTRGHTRGHQSLVVQTTDGIVVIAGQAVLTADEWNGETDPTVSGLPKAEDELRVDYETSVGRLHALEPVRVHFVHDPAVWQRGT